MMRGRSLQYICYTLILSLIFLSATLHAQGFVDPETPTNALPLSGGSDWVLKFSDEFNGNTLDTTKWGIDVSTKSRAARPTQGIDDWWWVEDNVRLDGTGNLVLDVVKHDANTMYCGSISSDGKYEPKYGYIEVRMQIADTTKSTHTAFWLQGPNMKNSDPADGTANDGAEVDVFESAWFGDYTKSVVHIDGYDADHRANTKQYSTPGLHSGYHVWGLEWTADSMKIYYDGTLKVSYSGIWVPQVNEWLWLSVGASFGDVGTFSSEANGLLTSAKVDYIRVWQSGTNLQNPTWSEEFNGSGSPDSTKWSFEQGFVRNEELQWYQSDNAWQENGLLIIEGRREQVANPNYNPGSSNWKENREFAEYTSSSIKTNGKFSFKYGRMQVRARIPAVTGAWPAIWTLGDTGEWPSNGECDLLEYYISGGKPSILANCARGTNTRWTAAWDSSKTPVSTYTAVDPDWENKFHIWTMQWDEDNVRLYIDNILLNTTPQSWLVNPVTTWGPKEPFKQPHYILLNLAIGANGGDPSGTSFPIRYEVDYVRVWEGATANVSPTDINLTNNTVEENLPTGTIVGNLQATDRDPAEVISYNLVSGVGSDDNALFDVHFISDKTKESVLKTKQPLFYADSPTRTIRVRATDIEGLTFEKVLTINITRGSRIEVSTNTLTVPESGTNTFGVRLTRQPASTITVNISEAPILAATIQQGHISAQAF